MTSATDAIAIEKAETPLFLGIDVGGTGIKFGLVDNRGRTIGRSRILTRQENGPEDACARMKDEANRLAARHDVDFSSMPRVGLATPGTMDIAAGKLLQPHNLPAWWDFPIRDHLQDVLDKPVSFQNDANAAAYGEYWVGSGADFRSMVFFTLGTGVGGGIIVDGHLIDGEHSHGSECGHTFIASGPSARMCGCGRAGHLEAYTCAGAVVARTEEALAQGGSSSITDRVAEGETLTPLIVAEEAAKDDPLALEIVMSTAEYLSYGAVNLIHIIDPDAIIFGGAMNFGGASTDLGQKFLAGIRSEIANRVFPSLVGRTHVDFALLGGHAGYIGAAAVARADHLKKASTP